LQPAADEAKQAGKACPVVLPLNSVWIFAWPAWTIVIVVRIASAASRPIIVVSSSPSTWPVIIIVLGSPPSLRPIAIVIVIIASSAVAGLILIVVHRKVKVALGIPGLWQIGPTSRRPENGVVRIDPGG
jgi:hypothetical protein